MKKNQYPAIVVWGLVEVKKTAPCHFCVGFHLIPQPPSPGGEGGNAKNVNSIAPLLEERGLGRGEEESITSHCYMGFGRGEK